MLRRVDFAEGRRRLVYLDRPLAPSDLERQEAEPMVDAALLALLGPKRALGAGV
jgi:hypothetical protein